MPRRVTFLFIARAIGFALDPLAAMGVIVLASLAAAIPAAPGYVGTFDAGILLGLHAAGVQGGDAIGVLLLARFLFFVPVTLVGLAVLIFGYGAGARLRREGEHGLNRSPRRCPPPACRHLSDQRSRT